MKVNMAVGNTHLQIIRGRKTEELATAMATTEWRVFTIMTHEMNLSECLAELLEVVVIFYYVL